MIKKEYPNYLINYNDLVEFIVYLEDSKKVMATHHLMVSIAMSKEEIKIRKEKRDVSSLKAKKELIILDKLKDLNILLSSINWIEGNYIIFNKKAEKQEIVDYLNEILVRYN